MRQFIAENEIDEKGCLVVKGKNYRYLSAVLRVKAGDMMDVRLKDGTLQPMTVAKIDTTEKQVVLTVAGSRVEQNQAPAVKESRFPPVYLLQFAAKSPKMDLIIRQAVECGVSCIVPVAGKFCQKGNIESAAARSDAKDQRWNRVITEARQQSGSPVDTQVMPLMTLEQACQWVNKQTDGKNTMAWVLYEQTQGSVNPGEFFADLNKDALPELIILAVGAEGGIAPEEVEMLKDSGFSVVHLETNILRCETAALYGIAAMQTVFCTGHL